MLISIKVDHHVKVLHMFLFAIGLTLLSSFFYVMRFSLVKDAHKYNLSNYQINFLSRFMSVVIMFIIAFFLKIELFSLSSNFILNWLLYIPFGFVFSFYQTRIYKSHFKESTFMQPLEVMFSLALGYIFFSETLTPLQILGIMLVLGSLLVMNGKDNLTKNLIGLLPVVLYYFLASFIGIYNKSMINISSPFVHTFYLFLGICVANFLFILYKKEKIIVKETKTNAMLLAISLLSIISFSLLGTWYKYLPLGIVACLMATQPLWGILISKIKYNDEIARINYIASLAIIVGVVLSAN